MKTKTKINVPPEFNLPADAPNAACLAIFNREDGAMFRIPISEKEFEEIWKWSIRPGALPLKDFIAAAICEKFERLKASSKRECDLEGTINKAMGLIDLLQSRLIEQAGASVFPALPGFDAATSSGICGIQSIANEVKMELLKCANTL